MKRMFYVAKYIVILFNPLQFGSGCTYYGLSSSASSYSSVVLLPTHGHRFFRRGGKNFFPCVHGSKMAIGEVMFLAALAWVKGGVKGGGENFTQKRK